MSSDTDNPYAAPILGARVNDHRSRSRVALVGVCRISLVGASFLIGTLSVLLGVLSCARLGWQIATEPISAIRAFMIGGCAFFLGLGVTWIIAGWFYWTRRYFCAIVANGVGVLICVIVHAVMEFVSRK